MTWLNTGMVCGYWGVDGSTVELPNSEDIQAKYQTKDQMPPGKGGTGKRRNRNITYFPDQ